MPEKKSGKRGFFKVGLRLTVTLIIFSLQSNNVQGNNLKQRYEEKLKENMNCETHNVLFVDSITGEMWLHNGFFHRWMQ